MKKIKILHITSSLKIGGAEAVLFDLICSMDASLFEHEVIFFHDGPYHQRLLNAGIKTYAVWGVINRYDPIALYKLYQLVKNSNPDCIHTLLWAANNVGRVIAKMLAIPVVSALHNNVEQDGILRNFFDRYTIGYADEIIAVSQGVAQTVLKRNRELACTITIISNGINVRSKANSITRASLGLSKDHFIIGSVGRFVSLKRYDLMLSSFALLYTRHPYARLMLIGVGPCEQQLRTQAQQLGIAHAVIFIIGQEAHPYYHLLDCFSLSSDKEGISIALLEAMSCRVPCVVTWQGLDHPVIRNGIDGLLVPAGNGNQLAAAWARLASDSSFANTLANSGYCRVIQHFNSKHMIEKYETIFKKLAYKYRRNT